MAKVKFNIEEQVQEAIDLIPSQPTDYQAVVDQLGAAGLTEATRVITLLKQRKMVKLAVGRDESGAKFHHISRVTSNESGA